MDGTIKYTPKNFYQFFNILAYLENENFYISIEYILMSNKSYELYKKFFNDIKYLLTINNINVDCKKINIICHFERSLLKIISEEFSDSKVNGCYFHYVKVYGKK